ncbi:uncharacterized protein DS421_5g171350 [Arachis hypogaea]|nr:uncharacterized protein DS421_5g171350 [Arachis hypogaea]
MVPVVAGLTRMPYYSAIKIMNQFVLEELIKWNEQSGMYYAKEEARQSCYQKVEYLNK